MEKKSVSPQDLAMAMVKHWESVFPPTKQAKDIIARVRQGGDEKLLEIHIATMLVEYYGEAVKLRDSMPEEVKKSLNI